MSAKSKRLNSSEDESDAETLDATMDEDAGYALNSSSSSSSKKAAYTQAKKKSGKMVLDDADDAKDISG